MNSGDVIAKQWRGNADDRGSSGGGCGIWLGLLSGLGAGLFFAAPWIMTNYAFAGRPRALWWIDGGHVVLACSAIGLVLGVFL